MYLFKNVLLIISLFITVAKSEPGYNTIYLMEFENQYNEFTNSHLTEALPDLIKENYNQDVLIEGILLTMVDKRNSLSSLVEKM